MPRFRTAAVCAALFGLASPALALPHTYRLDTGASTVGFETDFGTNPITGTMPVQSADLVLDFDRLTDCTVRVTLDVGQADASFPFAAEAMKGPGVLDAARHPKVSFASTAVRRHGEGALVDGQLTLRGVTRPVTLAATIYRQKGTVAGDLRHLTILLTGAVQRSDFGATGFGSMVGDQVRLRIVARIAAVD